jgi:cephalosporin hydroxylase
MTEPNTIADFHRLYYDAGRSQGGTWRLTQWLGVETLKCPLDLWIYQEILYDTKPDVIIEAGTHRGGSAYFLASVCDLIGNGRVITIDIKPGLERPRHPRITYLTGSSTAAVIAEQIRTLIVEGQRVMVVLDSDHSYSHVLEELRIYSQLVTAGCYLVVEDTNINGHPVMEDYGPGPMEAVVEFLRHDQTFRVDETKAKFLLSFNPCGYLKKIAQSTASGLRGLIQAVKLSVDKTLVAEQARHQSGKEDQQTVSQPHNGAAKR